MDQTTRAEELEQKRRYWKQHIGSWQETGLTQAEYCRRHNLKHHQLVYWKKRFSRSEAGVSFVSLKLEDMLPTQDLPDHDSFCLVINNHFKVEIRAGFDAQLLRQLIFALRGLP
jgi:hypothetical protein